MAKKRGAKKSKTSNGAVLGFEETLWRAADKLRHNMDPAENKHIVLGLTFVKYISPMPSGSITSSSSVKNTPTRKTEMSIRRKCPMACRTILSGRSPKTAGR